MQKANINRVTGCSALLALLAVGASAVVGQPPPSGGGTPPPKKTKSQLEDWLERAARNHPDVKVAEAKLRTAAAELERARSQVMQQVLSLHYAIEAQKIAVDRAEIEWKRASDLFNRKQASQEEFAAARAALVTAKAKLSELQAQVDHLVGKPKQDAHHADVAHAIRWLALQRQGATFLDLDSDGRVDLHIVGKAAAPKGPLAERIRKALNESLSLNAQERTLDEVLDMVRRSQPDLVIQVKDPQERSRKLTMRFTDLSLGAALQLLEDNLPGQRVVVREYGLLIAPEIQLPRGAVPLVEFWKDTPKPKK
jgi:hypothetical protein